VTVVGGLLASHFGTALSSVIATSLILTGQVILLFGDLTGSVKTMAFGMFIFGLGTSPLSVIQETIIIRFFKNHGLGVSLALGLVAGKGASFLSASTSFPLSEWNPHAPFFVATLLAAGSFLINIVYLSTSKWIAREAGVEREAAEVASEDIRISSSMVGIVDHMSEEEALRKVAEKRMVKLGDLAYMGDVFWIYIGINVLCGAIWSPLTHLAP
jgi:MFS family permease